LANRKCNGENGYVPSKKTALKWNDKKNEKKHRKKKLRKRKDTPGRIEDGRPKQKKERGERGKMSQDYTENRVSVGVL